MMNQPNSSLSPTVDPRVLAQVTGQPYPLLFASLSGAHLYGFPSPDSDYDLRGVHLLTWAEAVGLHEPRETIEHSGIHDGLEIDLVTHDARKFFGLLLKKNGYVLEQLYSPLVLQALPEHAELQEIARGCITRHHSHHYFGFADTQWRLFEKEAPRRVKPLLYVFRVLLTGIHLMRTGEVEANLLRLNETARLSYLDELIARKLAGPEKGNTACDGRDVLCERVHALESRTGKRLCRQHVAGSAIRAACAARFAHSVAAQLRRRKQCNLN